MTSPLVVALNAGLPVDHGADAISAKPWTSGIFKAPVEGAVWLDYLNLAGDGQADLEHHGGPHRALLSYAAAHYPVWRKELGAALPYGSFGENLTVTELDENSVCIGDVYAIGEEVRVQVAQPRYPCWKLARRNQIKSLTALVEARGWGGWYQRVLQVGYLRAGDRYTLLERPYPQYSIARLNALLAGRLVDWESCETLAGLDVLSPDWQGIFAHLLKKAQT